MDSTILGKNKSMCLKLETFGDKNLVLPFHNWKSHWKKKNDYVLGRLNVDLCVRYNWNLEKVSWLVLAFLFIFLCVAFSV